MFSLKALGALPWWPSLWFPCSFLWPCWIHTEQTFWRFSDPMISPLSNSYRAHFSSFFFQLSFSTVVKLQQLPQQNALTAICSPSSALVYSPCTFQNRLFKFTVTWFDYRDSNAKWPFDATRWISSLPDALPPCWVRHMTSYFPCSPAAVQSLVSSGKSASPLWREKALPISAVICKWRLMQYQSRGPDFICMAAGERRKRREWMWLLLLLLVTLCIPANETALTCWRKRSKHRHLPKVITQDGFSQMF